MKIKDSHIEVKNNAYWEDLTSGATGIYKSAMIEKLIKLHFPGPRKSLIDIGCGTCEEIIKYREILSAQKLTCTDYDAKVVEEMSKKHAKDRIDWKVADIFALDSLNEKYDLVFLMDMIHEVYSFYGRPEQDIAKTVDHFLGINYVNRAFEQISGIVNPGGGIILTDDVLSNEDIEVVVKIKNLETVEAVKYFLSNYPTKRINAEVVDESIMRIRSRDLNILLTQYNKIKAQNWARWEIERLEIHEYMCPSEYKECFEKLGFITHIIIGTPESAWHEWNADFEVLSGLESLPDKRITLLAIKN